MNISPFQERFILHWGEMGTRWGINRSVAQIHALLYLVPEALPADEIAATLSIARSNVSSSLRELQAWDLVRTVHVLGDRRDHFQAIADVWVIFERIIQERKRREMDPTLEMLRMCMKEWDDTKDRDPQLRERISGMLEFFETVDVLYERLRSLPLRQLKGISNLKTRLEKLLSGA